MKKIIQWLLFVCCVLIIGFWIHSARYSTRINRIISANDRYWIQSESGRITVGVEHSSGITNGSYPVWRFNMLDFSSNSALNVTLPLSNRLGFVMPAYVYTFNLAYAVPSTIEYFALPYWLLFFPLLLLTLKLWYAPLKAWWRRAGTKGFEVELSNQAKNERQDAESAKELQD